MQIIAFDQHIHLQEWLAMLLWDLGAALFDHQLLPSLGGHTARAGVAIRMASPLSKGTQNPLDVPSAVPQGLSHTI